MNICSATPPSPSSPLCIIAFVFLLSSLSISSVLAQAGSDITITGIQSVTPPVFIPGAEIIFTYTSKSISVCFGNAFGDAVDVWVFDELTFTNLSTGEYTPFKTFQAMNIPFYANYLNGSVAVGQQSLGTDEQGAFINITLPRYFQASQQVLFSISITDGVSAIIGKCYKASVRYTLLCQLARDFTNIPVGTLCTVSITITELDNTLIAQIAAPQVTTSPFYTEITTPTMNYEVWDGMQLLVSGSFTPSKKYGCVFNFIEPPTRDTLLYTTNSTIEAVFNSSCFYCAIPLNTFATVQQQATITFSIVEKDLNNVTTQVYQSTNTFIMLNYGDVPSKTTSGTATSGTPPKHGLTKTEYIIIIVVCGFVGLAVVVALITFIRFHRKGQIKEEYSRILAN